jgi:dephospho-CoA kinase
LLGENPRHDIAATIVVDIDPEVAVGRLVEFRGVDETDARNRIASQISREERLARATHVVDTSGDEQALRRQVDELWRQLVKRRGRIVGSRPTWLEPTLRRRRR